MTRARAIAFALSRGANAERVALIRRIYNKGKKMRANDYLQALYDDKMVENLAYTRNPFLDMISAYR